eukprot:468816-Pelagomonas_calceolata.AAC.1
MNIAGSSLETCTVWSHLEAFAAKKEQLIDTWNARQYMCEIQKMSTVSERLKMTGINRKQQL